MGKAAPSPYSKTLERAGMSWVVVTSTFTQLGLQQDTALMLLLWGYRQKQRGTATATNLELMSARALSACVSHRSVRTSISLLSWSHSSRFGLPSKPARQSVASAYFDNHSRPSLSAQVKFRPCLCKCATDNCLV